MNHVIDRGLADGPTDGNVKVSTILSPMFRGHEEPLRQTQFGFAPGMGWGLHSGVRILTIRLQVLRVTPNRHLKFWLDRACAMV